MDTLTDQTLQRLDAHVLDLMGQPHERCQQRECVTAIIAAWQGSHRPLEQCFFWGDCLTDAIDETGWDYLPGSHTLEDPKTAKRLFDLVVAMMPLLPEVLRSATRFDHDRRWEKLIGHCHEYAELRGLQPVARPNSDTSTDTSKKSREHVPSAKTIDLIDRVAARVAAGIVLSEACDDVSVEAKVPADTLRRYCDRYADRFTDRVSFHERRTRRRG